MLNFLYHLKINITKKLIPFLVKHEAFNLLSILIILNLSKIKKILPKKKNKYRVIVLNKSGGNDDLIESQKKYLKLFYVSLIFIIYFVMIGIVLTKFSLDLL